VLIQPENCWPEPGIMKAQNFKDRRAATEGMTHQMRFCLIPGHKFSIDKDRPIFEHKNLLLTVGAEKTNNGNNFRDAL
jgi:hypothetical protein